MIASVFSKSKPINFIIVFLITALAFFIAHFNFIESPFTFNAISKRLLLLAIGFATLILLNFIVSKNKLTKVNNYEILIFALFMLIMVETTFNSRILLSNFFVLLGLRRILSIRTQTRLNKKLFDAAFWISIAAIFYFWSILFFALIPISLALYTDNKLNHWLIPFTGALTVFIFTISVSLIYYDNYFGVFGNLPEISYDFGNYNSAVYVIGITIFVSYGIWSSLFYAISIREKKKALRPSFKTILFAFLIAFVIVILAPKKNGSEFLFLFAPLSIIVSNYIQIIKDKWFRELFLLLLIILPFILLFL